VTHDENGHSENVQRSTSNIEFRTPRDEAAAKIWQRDLYSGVA
jgi:hypothetical protein